MTTGSGEGQAARKRFVAPLALAALLGTLPALAFGAEGGTSQQDRTTSTETTTTTTTTTATETTTVCCLPPLDTTPPETVADKGPPAVIHTPKTTFRFSSEPGASFACKLDSRPYVLCTSPRTVHRLSPGRHAFTVAAEDAFGNWDRSPVVWRFRYVPGPTPRRTARRPARAVAAPPAAASASSACCSRSAEPARG